MAFYDYGSLSGDFVRNAAGAARNVACDLYSKFPKWAVGNVAINSPAWEFAQGAADSICKGSPTYVRPPKPTSQFNGGQCRASYGITFQLVNADGSSSGASYITRSGPIGGFSSQDNAQGVREFYISWTYWNGDTPETRKDLVQQGFTVNNPTVNVISIVRLDGQPDNCGNPPPDYPPSLTGSPSESQRNPNVNVPDSGGNNFNIPFFLPPDSLIDNDFKIKVDVGGITFNYSPDGVSFDPGNKGTGDGSPGSFDRPPYLPPDLGDKIDQANDGINRANDKLDDAANKQKERERRPPDDPDYEPDPKPEGDNSDDGVEKMKWLIVELTKLPTEGNLILKSDGQLIAYAGWVEFRVQGKGLPRLQLNYPLNIFPVPESVDGYAVTFTKGANGRVTVIKEKVTP